MALRVYRDIAVALRSEVPNLDEVGIASVYHPTSVSATATVGVFVAPFALEIVSASLFPCASGGATVAANSDTNYWTADLRRMRAGTGTVIASKHTKLTGGAALTYRTDWNYDAIAFHATNKLFQKGDACDFALLKSGAASDIPGLIAQVRYVPV
jgi:hypothetical protein